MFCAQRGYDMGKSRKRVTEEAASTNARIGGVLAQLREERKWTLKVAAKALGMSASHVSALETGQYNFTAVLIEKLSRVFQRPLSSFLREGVVVDPLTLEWVSIFEELPNRERAALLEQARRLQRASERHPVSV